MGNRKRILERILFLLYIGAVAVLCFARFDGGLDLSSTIFGIPKDKVVHFTMFLPFPIIFCLAFYARSGRPWRLVGFLVMALALALVIAAGTEIAQAYIKYRSADITDFRADSLGALTGAFLVLIFAVIKKKW